MWAYRNFGKTVICSVDRFEISFDMVEDAESDFEKLKNFRSGFLYLR